jgi:flagellar protein FlaG
MNVSSKPVSESTFKTAGTYTSTATKLESPTQSIKDSATINGSNTLEVTEENTAKIKNAVNTMNNMLVQNHSKSKFLYHEGLDKYYVTVVDKDTDEIVKEIPPRKLLDAFYEMQKMLGMIVDEKI